MDRKLIYKNMKQEMKHKVFTRVVEQWIPRMRQAKLTQRQLAKEASISYTTLNEIINFRSTNPRLETINKVEVVLAMYKV